MRIRTWYRGLIFPLTVISLILFRAPLSGQERTALDSLLMRMEEIAASDSATAVIHNNLGFYYVRLGRTNAAIEQYLQAVRMEPGYAEAYNNLGYAYSLVGQVENAIRAYQDAIRNDPGYADAYNNIGLILMNQNKIPEAIQQFKQAVRAKPEYHYAYGNIAFANFRMGRPDSAIAYADQAVDIQPAFAQAYNIRGLAYFQKREFETALKEYRKALNVNPQFADARYNLALTLATLGKYEEAVTELETLLGQHPSNRLFAYQLALQYFNTTKLEKARQLGSQLVNADSTWVEANLLMGRIEKAYGNVQSAREFFVRVTKYDPKLADPWYNLGVMDLNAQLLPEAEEELQRAKEIAPERHETNYALGLTYLLLQEPEQAIAAFEEELKLNPEFEQAKAGLKEARAMKSLFDQNRQKGWYRARIILVKEKNQADAILKRLKSGGKFAHLAFNNSILPNSKQGGDIGFVDPKDIDPNIENVLKKLKVGEVSSALKTDAGYQILLRLN